MTARGANIVNAIGVTDASLGKDIHLRQQEIAGMGLLLSSSGNMSHVGASRQTMRSL